MILAPEAVGTTIEPLPTNSLPISTLGQCEECWGGANVTSAETSSGERRPPHFVRGAVTDSHRSPRSEGESQLRQDVGPLRVQCIRHLPHQLTAVRCRTTRRVPHSHWRRRRCATRGD